MGLLDNMKARLGPAKEKVSDFAHEHGDKIGQGLDKAAKTVDEKTKGKYRDKIHTGTDKAKHAFGRMSSKEDDSGTPPSEGGGTPPGPPTS